MSSTFGISCSSAASYRNEFSRKFRVNKENTIKVKYLGVVRADPISYMKQYGDSLIKSEELPAYVKHIPNPPGIELAANKKQTNVDNNNVESVILDAIKTKTYEIVDEAVFKQHVTPTAETTVIKPNHSYLDKLIIDDKIKLENLKLTKHQVDYVIELLTKQIKYELQRINEIKNLTIY